MPRGLRTLTAGIASTSIAVVTTQLGMPGLLVAATVIVLTTAIEAVVPELFWLWALLHPRRDLETLLAKTPSVEDAERLWQILQTSHAQVLDARRDSDDAKPPHSAT